MTGIDLLYRYAEEERIGLFSEKIGFTKALVVHDENTFNIALDFGKIEDEYEERTIIMHELAHIATGAFYTANDALQLKSRAENQANKWLIQIFIKKDDIFYAIKHGCEALWELAEHFEITEDLMKEALHYYQLIA